MTGAMKTPLATVGRTNGPKAIIVTPQARVDPTAAARVGSSPTASPKPVYTGPCQANSPYGFTTPIANTTLVALYKQMNVCWLRFQIHVADIQTKPGVYNWSILDAVVAQMNAAGIHLDVPIQCFQASCFSNPYIPTANEMAQFATQIATRYNGQNGHGYIDAFEIGNEEYDANMSFPITNYGPILKAGYLAIKAVFPQAMVGMYGTYFSDPGRTTQVLNAIFQGGYGHYLDFMNFHYYNQGFDPRIDVDSLHPSFNRKWQLMRAIATQYGYASLPIWVTEVGWTTQALPGRQAVSAALQATYLQYVTEQASHSGSVQKIFWFTINYGNQPNSIYPASGPLPAFTVLKQYVQQYPNW